MDKVIRPIGRPQQMASYWKREWRILLVVAITGTLFNSGMSAVAVLQGRLIDTVADGDPLPVVGSAAALFLGVVAAVQILRYFKRYYVRLFANRTSATMRLMIYNNILSGSLTQVRQASAGDLMTRAVGDVGICVEGMRKVTTEVFDTGVLMVTYVITMLLYDVKCTLIACIFIPVAMWLAERLKKVIVRFNREARVQNSRMAELTCSAVENATLLRMNGAEDRSRSGYERELEQLEQVSIRAAVLENSMQPIYNAIAMLGVVLVIALGGGYVIAGRWTVGMFSSYITIFAALAVKASKAAKLFNSYQKAVVSWQRVRPYLTDYRTPTLSAHAAEEPAALSVRELCFTWPGAPRCAAEHISFEAREGQIIGITGPVACGKSSLGAALQGLYPYGGSVLLCGRELREWPDADRCLRISLLTHRPELFSASIRENIALGREGDISPVLHDVCFEEDLAAMPDGIETKVGTGGVRLSGGQQQRIALARTLFQRSRVMVLDDPFSAVDMKTENAIMERLRSRYRGCILLLISHRLTVFSQTDRVLFFDRDGSLLQGTHEDLLASSELYRSIYSLQTGGDRA